MNPIQITSNKIAEIVHCPTSKSYANRALILAALKESTVEIADLPSATDVTDLIQNFSEIGIKLDLFENTISIVESFPACESRRAEPVYLSGSEGGTTVRFLIPLLALGSNTYHVKMQGGLSTRPMQGLLDLLIELGAKAEITNDVFIVQGPLNLNSILEVDCSLTTQFASAFMLIASQTKLSVQLKNISGSNKYLEMTSKVIEDLKSNFYKVPYDASSLGYFVAYSICAQSLTIENVFNRDDYQADSKIFDLMDTLKISYQFSEEGLAITKPSSFGGFVIDGSACIDLVPTLAVIASFSSGESKLTNIKNLIHKESDRLKGILAILNYFKVPYNYNDFLASITIIPLGSARGYTGNLVVESDHRMIMVAALMLKLRSGGSLYPYQAVNKSFPEFFDIFL